MAIKKTLQKIGWKITKWLIVLSVLYSICVLVGVENVLPVHRVHVRTSRIDLTVLSLLCDLACLLVTAVLLRRQLGHVTADTTTVLTTGASLAAFMSTAVYLLCEGAVEHFLYVFLRTRVEPVHPLVLKTSFFYLTFSMYLFFSQVARLVGKKTAVTTVGSLVVLWTVVVSALSWGFLYVGLHERFTQEDTLVDVRKVDYLPLLVVSVLSFLVFDTGRRNSRNRNVVNIAEGAEG